MLDYYTDARLRMAVIVYLLGAVIGFNVVLIGIILSNLSILLLGATQSLGFSWLGYKATNTYHQYLLDVIAKADAAISAIGAPNKDEGDAL